jgi:hypothetical protein
MYWKINAKINKEIIRDPEKIKREIQETNEKIQTEKLKDRIAEITMLDKKQQEENQLVKKKKSKQELQITHPNCFTYKMEKIKESQGISELFLENELEVTKTRLENYRYRAEHRSKKEKLSQGQLMKKVKELHEKYISLLQSQAKVKNNKDENNNGNKVNDENKGEPVFIYRTKQYHYRAPMVPTVERLRLEGRLDVLKKKLNRTKQWITDMEYAKKTDKELKQMAKDYEYFNERIKTMKEKVKEGWNKLNQAKDRFNAKKNGFYKNIQEKIKKLKEKQAGVKGRAKYNKFGGDKWRMADGEKWARIMLYAECRNAWMAYKLKPGVKLTKWRSFKYNWYKENVYS